MVKEIKYTGVTASPSDYECPDGDLAAAINVVPEEGSLSQVMPPRQLFQLADGGNVRFVHETPYIRNFIILHPDNSITWRTEQDPDQYSHGTLPHDFSGRTIHQINAIGNTLVVLADDGMHYFLWKGYRNGTEQEGDHKEYLYLSNHMPEIDMSFGLKYDGFMNGSSNISKDNIKIRSGSLDSNSDIIIEAIPKSNAALFEDTVSGTINSLIERITKTGRFCMPFFVRYAYRLYDGTITMHSSPVLMVCTNGTVPIVTLADYDSKDYMIHAAAITYRLDYAVRNLAAAGLADWEDIIKSVDVFISSPIFRYDQTLKDWVTSYENADYRLYTAYGLESEKWNTYLEGQYSIGSSITEEGYKATDYKEIVKLSRRSNHLLYIPRRDPDKVADEYRDIHSFYLLRSIPIEELKDDRTVIPIEEDYLTTLPGKEIMTDDYNSHNTIIPQYSYEYNARLNITNASERIYSEFMPSDMLGHTDGTTPVRIYFMVRQDNREFVVGGGESMMQANAPIPYLYYPNTKATKAVICTGSGRYQVEMKPHQMLNGSYFYAEMGFDLYDGTHNYDGPEPTVTPDSERVLLSSNKIYTSEVNNPFYFPVTCINTIGTGNVMAITSATRAMSQGQFGQYPMYAFTSEGVWAMEVSGSGGFSSKHPITRDVCINPDSITQLDSSVLFATDRGIMLISGSSSICISDSLDYTQALQLASIPHSDTLLALSGFNRSDLSFTTFREFVKGCRMLYSYILQRIIVFNRDYHYAYVYSLKSKSWGMMPSSISHAIPSYPEAIAQLADGNIVDYSATADTGEATTGNKGVLITRPLKLDLPDVLKTVDTVVQRGNFQRGHVKSALFGSRDLVNWFIVWTSQDHYMRGFRGTPYKYYRIIVLCDLDPTESIYGCSIEYTPRYTDRLR